MIGSPHSPDISHDPDEDAVTIRAGHPESEQGETEFVIEAAAADSLVAITVENRRARGMGEGSMQVEVDALAAFEVAHAILDRVARIRSGDEVRRVTKDLVRDLVRSEIRKLAVEEGFMAEEVAIEAVLAAARAERGDTES